jgi:GNAT superfamily N-acetyltransferase
MSAYRFCRTDDIELLVDALNRCWAPYFPDDPPMTAAAFKRSIRDLHVWCSSCMVAFAGSDPIGVLIGAKRASATLVHKIAVHPDHRRQGHARHMLESLASKLAILGPPRIVAEVPETLLPARGLFRNCGYVEETLLTDYIPWSEENEVPEVDRRGAGLAEAPEGGKAGRFVIPVTVDDLAANGLLGHVPPSPAAVPADPQVCWERAVETLTARKDDIDGLAAATDERIEAFVLYRKHGGIVALRSVVEDGGARLRQLLSRLRAQGLRGVTFPKVHPNEMDTERLEALGFRPAGQHLLYATNARAA